MNIYIAALIVAIASMMIIKLVKVSGKSATFADSGRVSPIPPSVSFLEECPSAQSWDLNGLMGVRDDPYAILNFSAGLHHLGNDEDAVRFINHALSIPKLPYNVEIALHRNRSVAIATYLGLGSGKKICKDLEYCIVMEHLLQDLKSIIGLYVTNEKSARSRQDADILRESFNVALTNYMPYELSMTVYQDGASYHEFHTRLADSWYIDFVHDRNNALRVNGTVYRNHTMPAGIEQAEAH
ncbi:MAG: hypothetical protein LLG06_20180 [Desulfobacteraceae bacterium]|nr:hypothetical protein [Desulfobacteraceae bacterium]